MVNVMNDGVDAIIINGYNQGKYDEKEIWTISNNICFNFFV